MKESNSHRKTQIQVAGYTITQLAETGYETENKEQGLDGYFDAGHPNVVEVFVFNSRIPTQDLEEEDAVRK